MRRPSLFLLLLAVAAFALAAACSWLLLRSAPAAGAWAEPAIVVRACQDQADPEQGDLVLEVTDTGPGAADPGDSGLRGVAGRVADLSGSFDISSPPGAGTRVRIRLPLPATPAPHGPIRPAPPAPPT